MKQITVLAGPLFAMSLNAATVAVPAENVKLPVAFATGGGGAATGAAASQTALSTTTTTPAIAVFGGGGGDSGSAAPAASDEGDDSSPAPAADSGGGGRRASLPEYQQRRIDRTKRKPSVTIAPESHPAPSAKGAKDSYVAPPIEVPNPSPLILRAEGGYQSKYVYHGLDQVQLAAFGWDLNAMGQIVSSDSRDTDIWYLGAGIQWQGLSLSAKYVQSIEEFNPFYAPTFDTNEQYEEYFFDLNYTLGILDGGLLDATVGVEFRYFEQEWWWNTDLIYSFYGRLKSNKNPLFRPSITYFYKEVGDVLDSDTFVPNAEVASGQELIFQIDGEVTIGQFGPVTVGAAYYVEAGYYFDNLGDLGLDGFGHYGGGISLPVSVGGFTVSPGVHYHENDFSNSEIDQTAIPAIGAFGTGEAVPEFWWGVNASFTF